MKNAVVAPRTQKHLELLQAMVRGEAPPPNIAKLIQFVIEDIELGRSKFGMDVDERYANPMGTLHGGVVCDIADAAMGTAMSTTLEDDESFTTVDLTVKFFKPIWKARLEVVGSVVKRTRTLGLVEAEVTDDSGSLVAKLYSTCMVLRGDGAKGR